MEKDLEQIKVSLDAIAAMIVSGQTEEIKALRDLTKAMTVMSDNQNKMIAILKGLENE